MFFCLIALCFTVDYQHSLLIMEDVIQNWEGIFSLLDIVDIFLTVMFCNYRYTDMEAEDYSFYQGLEFLLNNDVNDLGYDLTFSTEVHIMINSTIFTYSTYVHFLLLPDLDWRNALSEGPYCCLSAKNHVTYIEQHCRCCTFSFSDQDSSFKIEYPFHGWNASPSKSIC